MNFFCHAVPPIDAAREAGWRQRLRPYFVELGLDPEMPVPASSIPSFSSVHCDLVAGRDRFVMAALCAQRRG
jgi:nitronate monooxygenase